MRQKRIPEDLGEPDLKLAGFQLWVHGRQFPGAEDYYGGNWLRVTAYCAAPGANVWAQGAIVMVTDIADFGNQCDAMLQGYASSAMLDPPVPELKVSLQAADRLGHIWVKVEITPEHLTQSHKMEFEIDQSYLSAITKQCSEVVQEYPIHGEKDRKGV